MLTYLIEDDDLKAESIMRLLQEHRPSYELKRFKSYQSGLRAIECKAPDLVILDMTVPTFDSGPNKREGRPRSLGGRDLLRKIVHKGIEVPVLVVTQFESFGEGTAAVDFGHLRDICREEFSQLLVGFIQYQATGSAWIDEVLTILKDDNQ